VYLKLFFFGRSESGDTIGGFADSGPDCFAQPNFDTNESPLLFNFSYIFIIIFDASIFLLAVGRMGRMYRAKELYMSHTSIVSILLRDSSILYAILAISNISSFVLLLLFIDGAASPTAHTAIDPNSVAFVVSSGTNSEMTHALSAILVSRMVFNLREAGTEVYEGTKEWHSRIEREVESMQFRVPTTICDGPSDFGGNEGDTVGAEARASETNSA